MNSHLNIIQQTHRIQKQIIDIIVPGIVSAAQIQNEVKRIYYERIVPSMQTIFDQYSSPGSVLKIEKLEVDIGNLSNEKLEEEFVSKVTWEIQAKLDELIKETDESINNANISLQDVQIKGLDAFIHFLKTGILLWSSDFKDIREYESELYKILQAYPLLAAAYFRSLFENDDQAILRCIYQFSTTFHQRILYAMVPEIKDRIVSLIMQLKTLLGSSRQLLVSNKELDRELWFRAFKEVALHKEEEFIKTEENIIEQSVLSLFKKAKTIIKIEYINAIYSEAESKANVESSFEIIRNVIERLKINVIRHNLDAMDTNSADQQRMQKIKLEEGKRLGAQQKDNQSMYTVEEMYIENAGLVLLHPFLHEYFKEMKLIIQKDFVDKEARKHGADLLQYIATGAFFHPEYELALNKIICGLSMSEPVDIDVSISDNETQEAENLLKAVIKHWSILKSTSPNGFRDNFLQRNGKISNKKDGNWLIQVERKPYDILINHLPWNLSIIKLPWLNEMIYVEW
jgi:hypothetical protein